ncbi:MAG: hypothetical protein ACR2H4_03310 [Pyrinomonadaceae bacterium]
MTIRNDELNNRMIVFPYRVHILIPSLSFKEKHYPEQQKTERRVIRRNLIADVCLYIEAMSADLAALMGLSHQFQPAIGHSSKTKETSECWIRMSYYTGAQD